MDYYIDIGLFVKGENSNGNMRATGSRVYNYTKPTCVGSVGVGRLRVVVAAISIAGTGCLQQVGDWKSRLQLHKADLRRLRRRRPTIGGTSMRREFIRRPENKKAEAHILRLGCD